MATAIVQHVVASSTASSAVVNIPISAVGSGRALIVCAADDFSATITGVSDGTAAFTQFTSAQAVQSSKRTDAWYLLAATAGATNIAVTFSSSVGALKVAWVVEVSGLTSPATDGANTATSASAASTTITGGSVTTTAADGVVVGCVMISFALNENPKAGTEFTSGGDMDASGQYGFISLAASSAAAHAPTWLDVISGTSFASSTAALKQGGAAAFLAAVTPRSRQPMFRASSY